MSHMKKLNNAVFVFCPYYDINRRLHLEYTHNNICGESKPLLDSDRWFENTSKRTHNQDLLYFIFLPDTGLVMDRSPSKAVLPTVYGFIVPEYVYKKRVLNLLFFFVGSEWRDFSLCYTCIWVSLASLPNVCGMWVWRIASRWHPKAPSVYRSCRVY
jgi:hypothetical protein